MSPRDKEILKAAGITNLFNAEEFARARKLLDAVRRQREEGNNGSND